MKSKKNFILAVSATVCIGIVAAVIIAIFWNLKMIKFVIILEAIVLVALMRNREARIANAVECKQERDENKKSEPSKRRVKDLKKRIVEPERLTVTCTKFEDVIEALKKSLPNHKLETVERVSSSVCVFHKLKRLSGEDRFFMAVDLRDEVRYPKQLFLNEVLPHMMNLNIKNPRHLIIAVLIICVDERDRWLDAFVENLEYDHNIIWLPVVVSFSDGKMLMARQPSGSGYGKLQYKKMRKDWLKIAEDGELLPRIDLRVNRK